MVCNINFIELLLTQRGYPQIVGVPFFYGVGPIDIFNSEMGVGRWAVWLFQSISATLLGWNGATNRPK